MDRESARHLYGRALRCYQAGQFNQAQSLCQELLSHNPHHADSLRMMGALAHHARKDEVAIDFVRRAIRSDPNNSQYHSSLGQLLLAQGDRNEAIRSLETAAAIDPRSPEISFYLGNAFYANGDVRRAIDSYRRSLAIDQRSAVTLNNLALALRVAGEMEEAMAAHRESLRIDPTSADSHSNYGGTLHELGLFDDAMAEFRQALKINPELIEAKGSLGLSLLLQGDLLEGFRLYESRLSLKQRYRDRKGPDFWDGSALQGRRILLRAEQGFGDTLHFIRYAPLLRDRGGHVVLEAPAELKRFLSGQLGIERVVGKGEPLPPCHVQCMLLTLPLHFQTTLETVPVSVPYLRADDQLAKHFCKRLTTAIEVSRPGNAPRITAGLVWAGAAHNKNDHVRSIPLSALQLLTLVRGVQLISLQKGLAAQQLQDASNHLKPIDFSNELRDFADTAALVANLDLIITVDTAVAHLGGALGKTVWLLLPYVPDWRWLLHRPDSPWYPTMRLFRQADRGNWASVVDQVVAELDRQIKNA